jgi:hypothetical protein
VAGLDPFSEAMSLLAYYIKERLHRPLSASVAYQYREQVKKRQHRWGDNRDKGKQYQNLFDAACVDVEHQLARASGASQADTICCIMVS